MAQVDISREQLKEIIRQTIGEMMPPPIPVGISNKHVHLTEQDYRLLFGDAPFEKVRMLTQPGEFASNQSVEVQGPKRTFNKVRVVGPFRKHSQIELSNTDARTLGISLPVRLSGNVEGSPGLAIVGPRGRLMLECGAIVAKRHIHMTPADAERYGVKHGDNVCVLVKGERPMVFCDTSIRVSEKYLLEMHLDTDEANAVGGDKLFGRIIEL